MHAILNQFFFHYHTDLNLPLTYFYEAVIVVIFYEPISINHDLVDADLLILLICNFSLQKLMYEQIQTKSINIAF